MVSQSQTVQLSWWLSLCLTMVWGLIAAGSPSSLVPTFPIFVLQRFPVGFAEVPFFLWMSEDSQTNYVNVA